MPVCPSCQAPLPSAGAPCRACGRGATGHPPAVALEVPDLDLSPRSSGPGPASLRGSARGRDAEDPGVGGAVFDEDDIFSPEGGGAGALELEDVRIPSAALAVSLPAGPIVRSPVETPRKNALVGGVESAVDPEALALADYGDPPKGWWQAPLYAYRVWTRRSELRRELIERRQDLAKVRGTCEDAKIAFGERARPIAEKSQGFTRALEPIAAIEKLVLERDAALSVEMRAHEERLRAFDERIAEREAELASAKANEQRIEGELAEAEAERQRAEAKVKRVEIEIRNANARAEADVDARGAAKGAGASS